MSIKTLDVVTRSSYRVCLNLRSDSRIWFGSMFSEDRLRASIVFSLYDFALV